MSDGEAELRALLRSLDPLSRDAFPRLLIRDQADRDAICKLYGWPQTFTFCGTILMAHLGRRWLRGATGTTPCQVPDHPSWGAVAPGATT